MTDIMISVATTDINKNTIGDHFASHSHWEQATFCLLCRGSWSCHRDHTSWCPPPSESLPGIEGGESAQCRSSCKAERPALAWEHTDVSDQCTHRERKSCVFNKISFACLTLGSCCLTEGDRRSESSSLCLANSFK